jgi:hypothetical protein
MKIESSIFAPGAGDGFRQNRVDFIQHLALIGTLWKDLLVDAFFAGAFHQIADFEIVFKFKSFFCHANSRRYANRSYCSSLSCSPLSGICKRTPSYHKISCVASQNT